MAIAVWVGRQKVRRQVTTITITTAATDGTITITVGGIRTVVITPTGTNTTTTAEELLEALQASTEGQFTELEYSQAANVITVTGPDDGAPFTIAKADGGSNVTALSTTAPLSPHDAADVNNWSTGALPVDATDSIVFEDSDVDVRYGLTALAAIELVSPYFTRRRSYTGRIGLPTTNANGYPEYRTTELQIESVGFLIETNSGDSAQQIRIQSMHASAVTVNVVGEGGQASIGSEVVEIRGTPANSVVNVVNSSLALVPLAGQTGTVLTLTGLNSTIRVGPAATLSGTIKLTNCQALFLSSWTTSLTTVANSTVEVAGSAAGVLVIETGTVTWHSTGNPGNSPVIGNGGTLDLSEAPAGLTIGGTVQMYAGSTLNDAAGKGGNLAVKTVHCTLEEVTWITADDKTYTQS